MKLSSPALAFFTTSLGLFTINLAISPPAQASIVCEPGTITNYANGSLKSCVLGQDTTLQVSSARSGTANFRCKAQADISFDDKGQFNSCQLSQDIQIRQGNAVETCPAEYWVNFPSSSDGNLSISCRR
jgi:hypothetical protein